MSTNTTMSSIITYQMQTIVNEAIFSDSCMHVRTTIEVSLLLYILIYNREILHLEK